MTKEKPILFSTSLVQAILRDEKSQTRRIINPQPPEKWDKCDSIKSESAGIIGWYFYNSVNRHDHGYLEKSFPHGTIGDQLWVRETFVLDDGHAHRHVGYRASKETWRIPENGFDDGKGWLNWHWKPSIFMPRSLSRIQLEITDLRAERLQDISEEEAMKEGMQIPAVKEGAVAKLLVQISGKYLPKDYGDPSKYKSHFAAKWDELNLKRGYGWKLNPWVWVITFRRVK